MHLFLAEKPILQYLKKKKVTNQEYLFTLCNFGLTQKKQK